MSWRARMAGPADDANVSLVFAFFLPVALILLAFAIDLGTVGLKKRELQGATDLAAILAAQNLADYRRTALENLDANGFGTRSVGPPDDGTEALPTEELRRTKAQVERGIYSANPDVPPSDRFVPNAHPANAVRVTTTHKAEYFFASGFATPPELSARSVAYIASEASFTVGTRLARVEGGLANQFLNAVLGTDVSLTAMDYNALVTADVSVFSTLDALATEASLEAVTYADVLSSDVTLSDLARSMADCLPTSDPARPALSRISSDSAAKRTLVDLAALLDLGVLSGEKLGSIEGPYTIHAGVLPFLSAAAELANGEHQVAFDLDATVPGLAGVRVTLLVGERPQSSPWLTLTSPDTVVLHTAQTRLLMDVSVEGLSLLAGTSVRLPIYAELASADASLARVSCPGGRESSGFVDLFVAPSVARVRVAEPDPANLRSFRTDKPLRPAILADTPLFDLIGQASIEVGGRTPQRLRFTAPDIIGGEVKTVSSKDLTASLTASLLEDLDLTVKAGGVSVVSPRKAQAALSSTVLPVASDIDELLASVLSIAGVSLGEADVRVNGLYCRHAVLVQ